MSESRPAPALPDPLSVGDSLTLEDRRYRVEKIFKADAYALTVLLERADDAARPDEPRRVVFKRSRFVWYFGFRPPRFLERFLARKEISNYRRVDGIAGVPRFLGQIGPDSHLHEFVEGVTLNVFEGTVNDRFFPELGRILDAVHERGLAYVDFAKDENIVVGEDGAPALIDFQICFDHGNRTGILAPFHRWMGRKLMKEDRKHLLKHRIRYRPDQVSEEEKRSIKETVSWKLWRLLIKKPYNIVTRRIPVLLFGEERAGRRNRGEIEQRLQQEQEQHRKKAEGAE